MHFFFLWQLTDLGRFFFFLQIYKYSKHHTRQFKKDFGGGGEINGVSHFCTVSALWKRSHYGTWQKTFPSCQWRQPNLIRNWRALSRSAQEMENNSRKNQSDETWSATTFLHTFHFSCIYLFFLYCLGSGEDTG